VSSPRGSGGTSAAWVERARARLLEQRSFRLTQLEELVGSGLDRMAPGAPPEIEELLRTAAEAALADVDAALRRIEQGTYGRCSRCAGLVSRARLEAVPSAPLCWSCHHAVDSVRQANTP
jgi:DnaK suppressor protein